MCMANNATTRTEITTFRAHVAQAWSTASHGMLCVPCVHPRVEGTTEKPMDVTDIRICFIADAFVNGTGDPCCLGWTGRVCAAAMARGYPITYDNLGSRRATSADIAVRWQDECVRRLPPSIDGRVVISCGANDTTLEQGWQRLAPAATLQYSRAIVQEARQHYPTLLVGPPPVAEAAHTARIAALCHVMGSVAQDLGCRICPCVSGLLKPRRGCRRQPKMMEPTHGKRAMRPWRRWCRHGRRGSLQRPQSPVRSRDLSTAGKRRLPASAPASLPLPAAAEVWRSVS
jgi:lysophospholipase L1-like esterase